MELDLIGYLTPIQALSGQDHRHLCVMLRDDHGAALIGPTLKPNRGSPLANGIDGNAAH
jgi:hypothetical protein